MNTTTARRSLAVYVRMTHNWLAHLPTIREAALDLLSGDEGDPDRRQFAFETVLAINELLGERDVLS